jgi:hypothetical protein
MMGYKSLKNFVDSIQNDFARRVKRRFVLGKLGGLHWRQGCDDI